MIFLANEALSTQNKNLADDLAAEKDKNSALENDKAALATENDQAKQDLAAAKETITKTETEITNLKGKTILGIVPLVYQCSTSVVAYNFRRTSKTRLSRMVNMHFPCQIYSSSKSDRKLTGNGLCLYMHDSQCFEHMDSSIFYDYKIFEKYQIEMKKNSMHKNFLVKHKKTTEEIVRVKKEKDAVTATLAKRNDQLIDAVKRAREAIKVLQPVAVSVF